MAGSFNTPSVNVAGLLAISNDVLIATRLVSSICLKNI